MGPLGWRSAAGTAAVESRGRLLAAATPAAAAAWRWNRQHQPHFPVQRQQNQQHLSCHQQRSTLISSNAFVYRHSIHTSAEDRSLDLEGRATAGRTPRGTKKNHRSQRTHRWAPYRSVCDADGADIWPASVGYHGGLRGTAPLVESTVIPVASSLRHAGPSQCSRMPTWSLRLAVTVEILREITMTAAAGV